MISCAEFLAEMGNYIEGDVADLVRLQLESHLSHCRMCQVVYDSSRKTLRVVTDSGCFDLPEEVSRPIVSKVMSRIRGERDKQGTER